MINCYCPAAFAWDKNETIDFLYCLIFSTFSYVTLHKAGIKDILKMYNSIHKVCSNPFGKEKTVKRKTEVWMGVRDNVLLW